MCLAGRAGLINGRNGVRLSNISVTITMKAGEYDVEDYHGRCHCAGLAVVNSYSYVAWRGDLVHGICTVMHPIPTQLPPLLIEIAHRQISANEEVHEQPHPKTESRLVVQPASPRRTCSTERRSFRSSRRSDDNSFCSQTLLLFARRPSIIISIVKKAPPPYGQTGSQ
jgi:hypothetical protein